MITILTLGCKTNQAESSALLRDLNSRGFSVSEKLQEGTIGGIYVINTCAVTGVSERKSRHLVSTIRRRDNLARIIVMGCASENNAAQFDGVEKVFGTDKAGVLDYLASLHERPSLAPKTFPKGSSLVRKTRAHYLKVQDGCDNSCAFCIVSTLRGPSSSRPLPEILNEAKTATAPELVITGINLAQFQPSLAELCTELDKLGKPFRISSLYIDALTPELLASLRACKNLVHAFHLSIQTCSDPTLASMGRRYNVGDVVSAVKHLREFENSFISADIIVGFPTETDEDFEATKRVLQKLNLDHLHVFPFSPRPGTRAANLPQLRSSVITTRANELGKITPFRP